MVRKASYSDYRISDRELVCVCVCVCVLWYVWWGVCVCVFFVGREEFDNASALQQLHVWQLQAS